MSHAPHPNLLEQAILLETMLTTGLVEAYRKHRRLRPAEDAAISESLWASVRALREYHERTMPVGDALDRLGKRQ